MTPTSDAQLCVTRNGHEPCNRGNLEAGHASAAERTVVSRGDLTKTELVVAILLARGLRQTEVAKLMNSSVEGVRSEIARIRGKTGARSTCHAVAELLRAGVID